MKLKEILILLLFVSFTINFGCKDSKEDKEKQINLVIDVGMPYQEAIDKLKQSGAKDITFYISYLISIENHPFLQYCWYYPQVDWIFFYRINRIDRIR